MAIIDGQAIAQQIKKELAVKAQDFLVKHGRKCGLAVILVGTDPASEIYVNNKKSDCEQVGIASILHKFESSVTQDELLNLVARLNKDATVDGILVQLPLPKHIDSEAVLENIAPSKDVDGFCAVNTGKLMRGEETIVPCTAIACLELIKSTGVELAGSHAVIVGRSNIVGKPAAQLLLNQDCTVTIAHSKTKDIAALTRQADILISAVGKKHLITADMVKQGAVVIDVGISREITDGKSKLYGDVDFENVQKIASHITPVPGGVGPMTRAMLLKNVLRAD